MENKIRAHIFISGRVQGVFFRRSVEEEARELGVFGFVRNLPNGRVEAVFEGEKERVEKLVGFCRQGPGIVRVERMDVVWEDYKGEFNNFEIK